jgi:hypothetical protein
MTTFVLGNGASLHDVDLNRLMGHRTYAVNRIWKLWQDNRKVSWRPTDYVRCERPRKSASAVQEDIREMVKVPHLVMHLERGMMYTWRMSSLPNVETKAQWIDACNGREAHDWHFPTVCTYGTVVTTAIQIAILDGAKEIVLLGCDLGKEHFYRGETFWNQELAYNSHVIASKCSPIPIYDASNGELSVYEKVNLDDVLKKGL